MLLAAEHISKNYGTKQLLQDVSLYLNDEDKIGIIGINGTGKSTLLKILAGVEYPDEGNIAVNSNTQILYLPQNPIVNDGLTVLEQVFAKYPSDFSELAEYEAKAMLTKLGITDFEQKIGNLSGGQRKRVALATVLIHPADILILDEPTNHLDSDMVTWLEQHLRRFTGGLIMVTHDRYFLERIINHIVELSRGSLYSYEANYSKYLELKAQRIEMVEASERKRQSILRREYQWIMRGPRARGTKSRDRIERYDDLVNQAAPEYDENVKMVSMNSRLGRKTIELSHVSKSFDGNTVVKDFSYVIKRDDRIGIVGRNGVGKSTLLNIITGQLTPDKGTVDTGATVSIGYFSQESRELNLNQRVYDFINEVASEIMTPEGPFTASMMLERFLFTSDLQYTNIGRLSGGERRRLFLLSILMAAPNILLLDEPTNDLDIETLTILEDYLESFSGAVIAVSHDRFFLDKVATSIFEVCEGGETRRYSGNYSDYIDKRELPQKQTVIKKDTPQKNNITPSRQKLKFTYKEQHEYEVIDSEIAALESQLAACDSGIIDSSSDYIKLQEIMSLKEKLQTELEAKTERWLYLNELAEKIEEQNN